MKTEDVNGVSIDYSVCDEVEPEGILHIESRATVGIRKWRKLVSYLS